MKTYKVKEYFQDAKDGNRIQNVGDTYPRAGLTVSDERIRELSTPFNARGMVLIEEIKSRRSADEDEKSDEE